MKKFNLGWALLKIWMCYEVVLVHCQKSSVKEGWEPAWLLDFFNSMKPFCVPVFMTIAFYLAATKFAEGGADWLKKRFVRLLEPWIFWSLAAFATWRLLGALGVNSPDFAAPWDKLGWQLLLGTTREYGSQMWFQAVLVIDTALIAIFFKLLRREWRTWGLAIMLAAVVAAEYTGLNHWLFKDMIYEVCNPLGRVIPMLAYAAIGLFFGLRKDALEVKGLACRWGIVLFAAALAILFINVEIFIKPKGFYYCGLKMLAVAFALVTAFKYLPTERIGGRLESAIVTVSKCTMGIYFIHIFLGKLLANLVYPHLGITPMSYRGGTIVFALSLAICLVARLIPNQRIKALFE